MLEAMACGNAIVASDVGDTKMFVNDNIGILINLNADELVAAIEYLYTNKILCEKLGKYAYSFVRQNHTIEKTADYYKELFKKLHSEISNQKGIEVVI